MASSSSDYPSSSFDSSFSSSGESSLRSEGEEGPICAICRQSTDDAVTYGEMFCFEQAIYIHHFCLLTMSSIRETHNKFTTTVDGFGLDGVIAALNRNLQNVCCICQERSAAIKCCVEGCSNYYHFPCGEGSCLSWFTDDFRSYCHLHVEDPNEGKKFENPKQPCLACWEPMRSSYNPVTTLISSCCLSEPDFAIRFIHKRCVQSYTRNAGNASMCITCNKMEDNKVWQEEMRRKGIYIPEKKANWDNVCKKGKF